MGMNSENQQKSAEDKLEKSLKTVIGIVMGDELKAIRESITALGSDFEKKVDDLKQSNKTGMDSLREELNKKITTMDNRISDLFNQTIRDQKENTKNLTESETRILASTVKQKEEFEKSTAKINEEIDKVKKAMESNLSLETERTTKKIATLDKVIVEQENEQKRVNSVLSKLAGVFGQNISMPDKDEEKSKEQEKSESNKESKSKEEDKPTSSDDSKFVDPTVVNWLGKRSKSNSH